MPPRLRVGHPQHRAPPALTRCGRLVPEIPPVHAGRRGVPHERGRAPRPDPGVSQVRRAAAHASPHPDARAGTACGQRRADPSRARRRRNLYRVWGDGSRHHVPVSCRSRGAPPRHVQFDLGRGAAAGLIGPAPAVLERQQRRAQQIRLRIGLRHPLIEARPTGAAGPEAVALGRERIRVAAQLATAAMHEGEAAELRVDASRQLASDWWDRKPTDPRPNQRIPLRHRRS
jgi:hypothetical protein